jgi:hypothetical protein
VDEACTFMRTSIVNATHPDPSGTTKILFMCTYHGAFVVTSATMQIQDCCAIKIGKDSALFGLAIGLVGVALGAFVPHKRGVMTVVS